MSQPTFRVVLVGDQDVGKSSLFTRFADDKFEEGDGVTSGPDMKEKVLDIGDGEKVLVQIWDTAGHERFRTMTSSYYRGADGIMMIYSVTDEQSLENLGQWMKQSERYASDNVIFVVLGNKTDVPAGERIVVEENATDFCDQFGIPYFEVSAKTGDRVEQAFIEMARLIKEEMGDNPTTGEDIVGLGGGNPGGSTQSPFKKMCNTT